MDVKTCKQCGELKPISQFRKYYGGRKGTYKMCKQCERINSRAKYLEAKGECMNWEEEAELDKIRKLYDYQRSLGLQPPNTKGRRTALSDDLDAMLDKYKGMTEQIKPAVQLEFTDAPLELLAWLLDPLTAEPDYYMDEVYEKLLDTYRPCTGIDKVSMMPVYDNKYKAILDRILERFTAYEDNYYEGTEG